MTNSEIVVAYDFDDVLVDFVGALVTAYNVHAARPIKYSEVTQWDLDEVFVGLRRGWWKDAADNRSFYYGVYPFYDAFVQLPSLLSCRQKGIRPIVVTNSLALSGAMVSRYQCFLESFCLCDVPRFDAKDFIQAADKSLVYYDALLDDNIDNVRAAQRNGALAYLMDRPWNRHAVEMDRIRVTSIAEYLEEVERWQAKRMTLTS